MRKWNIEFILNELALFVTNIETKYFVTYVLCNGLITIKTSFFFNPSKNIFNVIICLIFVFYF